jgi:hypothetical protein
VEYHSLSSDTSLETGKQTGNTIKNVSQTIMLGFLIMNDETFLNERVEVITSFGEGLNPCRPVRFRRPNGRVIEIIEIGLRHSDNQGLRTIHIFDVTDGGADYRLELDSERLTWHLTREMDHYESVI